MSVISAAFIAFCQVVRKDIRLVWGNGGSHEGITYGQILLVGEDQEVGIAQLVLVQHALQLLPGLNDTIAIVRVDDEDDTLGVLEVVPPQRSNLVLSTDIPHGERDVLVLDRLDVEAFTRVSMPAIPCLTGK